jgi:uncharacterized repeat protein (TIGR04076 family)
MNRREFLERSGCSVGCVLGGGSLVVAEEQTAQPRRLYRIEIDIFEARKDTWCHKQGDRFEYPKDMGRICPWLMASMHDFIVVLQNGANLNWRYENTPYQKVIDSDGVTTEFVRCPDPTSNLVARITRTKLG